MTDRKDHSKHAGKKAQPQQGGSGAAGQQQQQGETPMADNPDRARMPAPAQDLPGMEQVNEDAKEP